MKDDNGLKVWAAREKPKSFWIEASIVLVCLIVGCIVVMYVSPGKKEEKHSNNIASDYPKTAPVAKNNVPTHIIGEAVKTGEPVARKASIKFEFGGKQYDLSSEVDRLILKKVILDFEIQANRVLLDPKTTNEEKQEMNKILLEANVLSESLGLKNEPSKYDQLKEDMTWAEVFLIFGENGRLVSESEVLGTKYEVRRYEDILITFVNGKLKSKSR